MKAIEIESKTDKKGHLKIDYKLNVADCKVKVLILVEDIENKNKEEQLWLKSIANNPAFNFLNDPEEDIYATTDGKSIDA
ncbi:MAG: hypothetical protein L3J06_06115 [Cyclobacteriaceae bacterium]|nr:hypothetical protein [Cyclobacteriaceae bacterium]